MLALGSRPPELRRLEQMLQALAHRGPDDQNTYEDSRAAVGYRRLAIIDLREVANQPMANEDDTVHVVFNGEIYNFQELRADLLRRGHTLRSLGDTEVIAHLYEEHGLEFVHQLRGMFAIALWDSAQQRLILARDRVGKKPLFYLQTADFLAFGSEIKALLAAEWLPRRADPIAIDQFLSLQYVPAPRTGFEGIHKLPAGSMLVVEAGQVSVRAYWQLKFEPKLVISEEDAADELLSLLRESVRLRMISDVPLGAFLSGGIDSSTIVALMAEQTSNVKTFTIGFPEPDFDEIQYARSVAHHFGTDHRDVMVEPDAVRHVSRIVWQYDQPYSDVSAIPTYYLSRLTAGHVKVALTGDGGDECFAGYPRYQQFLGTELLARLPAIPRRSLAGAARTVTRLLSERNYLGRRLFAVADMMDGGLEERYAAWVTSFRPSDKQRLYTADFRTQLHDLQGIEPLFRKDKAPVAALDRLLDVDVATYLPDDLLVKVDIASMAWSLECRSPFLDQKVMEFAARLPTSLKLRGRTSKYLLKKVFEKRLPAGITNRPKQGFGVPIGAWMRDELRDFTRELLLGREAQRGLFEASAVQRLLDEHQSGRFNHAARLWPLLALEIWYRTFIDNDGKQPITL